jgi:hypothetical protein
MRNGMPREKIFTLFEDVATFLMVEPLRRERDLADADTTSAAVGSVFVS